MAGKKRGVVIALFASYCLFIMWVAVLSRKPTGRHEIELRLLWSYRLFISGGPDGRQAVIQNLQNILFFVPFGLLLPAKRWWIVALSSLCLSVTIEALQFIGGLGLAELDDVICNVIGAIIGFFATRRISKFFIVQKGACDDS